MEIEAREKKKVFRRFFYFWKELDLEEGVLETKPAPDEVVLSDKQKLILQKLNFAIDQMDKAEAFAKISHQNQVALLIKEFVKEPAGWGEIYRLTPRLVKAGILTGTAWEDPSKLSAPFAKGCLLGNGSYPIMEALSDLRILAIAEDKLSNSQMTREEAKAFLNEVLALNLDFVFNQHTEESRVFELNFKFAQGIVAFLLEHLDFSEILTDVVSEIDQICAQRPIVTKHVSRIIKSSYRLAHEQKISPKLEAMKKLDVYYGSIKGPGELANKCATLREYRELIKTASGEKLKQEALAFGQALVKTGLASKKMAVFLRELARSNPDLIHIALGLNESGGAELKKHMELVKKIIRVSVKPSSSNSIYGLARALQRNLLSRREVSSGIDKIVRIDFDPRIERLLLKRVAKSDSITANGILLSGIMSVLGQPLGIGQGNNSTCQAARGMSLWSQHAPGYLIDLIVHVVRNHFIEMEFEGALLNSNNFLTTNIAEFDPNFELDPVSAVLVPHLDVIYNEMMRRTTARGEDGHKWANVALYGRWVHFGFTSVLDATQSYVKDFENFIRRFYATHHPKYNDNIRVSFANPVGIFVTSSHAKLLGLHAVSIQRVEWDPKNILRVYFFNPNNEGRQDWGQGIVPSVSGHGERSGESSLPFNQFASRLYAYHFNPYEEGDGYAVDDDEIREVIRLAKESWGQSYQWSIS